MLKRHTGANISRHIEHLIHEFQLPQIAVIVHDNASNMDLATKILGYPTLGCFDHILQLAIGKALDADCFAVTLARWKRIVAFFSRFVLAHDCLMAKQEKGMELTWYRMSVPGGIPPSCLRECWKCTFHCMLFCMIEQLTVWCTNPRDVRFWLDHRWTPSRNAASTWASHQSGEWGVLPHSLTGLSQLYCKST